MLLSWEDSTAADRDGGSRPVETPANGGQEANMIAADC